MIFNANSIRVFKCLQKSYYELNRLHFDIAHNETAVMHRIFSSSGFGFLNSERKGLFSKRLIDGNLDPTDLATTFETPAKTKYLRAKLNTRLSNASFGYRNLTRGKVKILESEAELVRTIFASFIISRSVGEVRKVLDQMGVEGFDWKRVYNILKNGFYAGRLSVDGYLLHGGEAVPAIIKNEVYLQAQEILKAQRESKVSETYLLSRFVTRTETTRYFCGYTVRKKSGLKFYYYGCNRNAKGHYTIRADDFENLFQEFLMKKIDAINRCTTYDHFGSIQLFLKPTILKLFKLVSSKFGEEGSSLEVDLRDLGKNLEYFANLENYKVFGKSLLSSSKTLWLTSDQKIKRDIQFILFPYGISFDCATKQFQDVVDLWCGQNMKSILQQNPGFTN